MRLRVVSDGSARGTRVESESGDAVERVQAVEWRCDVKSGLARVRLELAGVKVEVTGESGRQADHWTLCCVCGEITADESWVMLVHDYETDTLREPRPGEMDPVMVCPVCTHAHRDDDSGGGLYQGSLEEMRREREQLVEDPVYRDAWEDRRALRVATAVRMEMP